MRVLTRWCIPAVACCVLSIAARAQVASVRITPAGSHNLQVGSALQLTALPIDSAGNSLPPQPVVWTSTNAAITTVSSTGLVTAIVPGTSTIIAAIGTRQAQSAITVTATPPAPAQPDSTLDRAVAKATFVFIATVHSIGTFNQQTPPPKFAAVTVDTAVRVPQSIVDFGSDTITLVYRPPITVTVGQKYVVYATGLSDDSTLVLTAIELHVAASSAAWVAALADSTRAAEVRVADRKYWARYDAAAVVVVGVIRSIAPVRRTMAQARVSEHEGNWRRAVVDVQKLHKGPLAVRNGFTMVFPASRDIRYARHTPPAIGDVRLFTLKPWSTLPVRLRNAINTPNAYVLLDSLDNLATGDTMRITRR